jgi:hypothetical protein
MAQYPVEDSAGILEGVNYLLSGPAGLGQNFQGFADYNQVKIRPTGRAPYVLPNNTTLDPSFYISLTVTGITPVDVDPGTGETRQIQVNFTASPAYTNAPFQYGDRLTISNTVATGPDPDFFNGTYTVLSSTTTSVTLFTRNPFTWPSYSSGGTVGRNFDNTTVSTDCNSFVTIYGPTDRVFISNQLRCDFTYNYSTASTFDVVLQINRYRGFPEGNDFIFYLDGLVSQQTYPYTADPAKTGTFNAIFTTAIDSPSFGYYWYICEIKFVKKTGDVTPGVFTAGLRSLTAQVIKE